MFSIESASKRKDEQAEVRRAVRKIREFLNIHTQRNFTEAELMITEIQCFDPECVPLETLVIIMEEGSQRKVLKILKPLLCVTEEDVIALVRQNNLAVAPPPPPAITVVDMVPREHGMTASTSLPANQAPISTGASVALQAKPYTSFRLSGTPSSLDIEVRHKKGGVRQRGCPCCDPDSLENVVDRLLLQNTPP